MDSRGAPESPAPTPPRRGHRLWIPVVLISLAALGVLVINRQPDLERNLQGWVTWLIVALTGALVVLWFLLLSRVRWTKRLLCLALLALAGFAATRLLRVDGTLDGRGLPRLAWKGSTLAPRPGLSAPVTAPAPTTPEAVSPGFIRDYPQFLGPRRDGTLTGAGLARDWATSPPRELWRQSIGAAWSAFAVSGTAAYTQEQRGEDECVTCYDAATGTLRWSRVHKTRFYEWQGGEGPRATPTVHAGRVYAFGANGLLECLEAETGRSIWSRDVFQEHGIRNLMWGASASPLVFDDTVVITGGLTAGPTVLAFDRNSGSPRWQSGSDQASYASPVLLQLAGQPVILSFNAATLSAHDPVQGTVRLEHRWGTDKWPKAAQPTILERGRVFLTAGYGMGCEMLQLEPDAAGNLGVTSLWKNLRLKAQFNSVHVREGFLYGLDDGLLACVDAATGERRWKDGRFGSGQTLLVDDLILVQSEPGDVVLAEASPDQYRELGRIRALSSKTWNHPTLAGRLLLVRNDREAVAYELPAVEPPPPRGE